jgi:hypothetical protein
MKKYSEDIRYVLYKDSETGNIYALDISDVYSLDKHFSDMDEFLYAPDDLYVDGILTTYNPKNGIIDYDPEHMVKIKVKNLKSTWTIISD